MSPRRCFTVQDSVSVDRVPRNVQKVSLRLVAEGPCQRDPQRYCYFQPSPLKWNIFCFCNHNSYVLSLQWRRWLSRSWNRWTTRTNKVRNFLFYHCFTRFQQLLHSSSTRSIQQSASSSPKRLSITDLFSFFKLKQELRQRRAGLMCQ